MLHIFINKTCWSPEAIKIKQFFTLSVFFNQLTFRNLDRIRIVLNFSHFRCFLWSSLACFLYCYCLFGSLGLLSLFLQLYIPRIECLAKCFHQLFCEEHDSESLVEIAFLSFSTFISLSYHFIGLFLDILDAYAQLQ